MTDKIGRNDLCSCGSGKKYKKCCMNKHLSSAKVLDYTWLALRKTEGTIIDNHLASYMMQELPQVVVKAALEEFCFEELPEEMDRRLLFTDFFMPWSLFDWIPCDDFGIAQFDPDKTIAQNYVKIYGNKLSILEKRFIEAISNTYYSFYSVLDVEPEESITIKDIMLGTTHTVKERQGTHNLKRGSILFSRILTLDDRSIFIGMAPFIIPPGYHIDLIDFRRWLIEENDDNELNAAVLRDEFDMELRNYFFEIMDTAFNRPLPVLVNTDGDHIQLSKTYFKLAISPEEALQRLLPLTLSKNAKEFLDDAKRDKSGAIKKIDFPWLKKGNKQHKSWKNTIMGHVILENGKLILETNSNKRTEQGKKLLGKYLGDAVSFQKTLIESLEEKLEASSKEPGKNPITPDLLKSHEVQAQMKGIAKAHWKDWFDKPIPMLGNQTPREAAKTEEGREKLEVLLLHYESYDQERDDNVFKADIGYLKAELGLN